MILKKRRWHCLPGQEPTEMDRRIMEFEKKGKLVPTRNLIKTPEQIEGIRRAGVVNTGCLDAVADAIHAGMNTQEIDDICMAFCKEHNATPACLNYEGYPKSVCTSINEVVCHGIPKKEDVLQEGDIVNVDMTCIVDGYFADSSLEKLPPKKNNWCVLPRNASRLARLQPSLTRSSETLGTPYRSMPKSTDTASCATFVGMAWAWSSTKSPKFCTTDTGERACCWCLEWCSPSSQ